MNASLVRKALVVCLSTLESDPRVVREIKWLISGGWIVDTLGLGDSPLEAVRDHFAITPPPPWTNPRPIKGLILAALPYAARFRVLVESCIPRQASNRVREGAYDLVLINDIDLLPWAVKTTSAARRNSTVKCHLDLHEYHPRNLPEGTSLRFLMTGYHRWLRRFIPNPAFASRSVVAGGIAELYASEFHIPRPEVVRNSPPFVRQEPSPVNPNRIELIYHGHAAWARGLKTLVDAMRLLDERFVLTLMLTGSPQVRSELQVLTHDLVDRVTFMPAVPMSEVAVTLNRFDLEVMFFPPSTQNLRLALPNKLFEAVQGRLGLVIGSSPSMVEVVEQYENGVVVSGWQAEDLAASLNALTAEQIERMKHASDRSATELSSEGEQRSFFRGLDGRQHQLVE